jgi:tryptophan synthase alpha chain
MGAEAFAAAAADAGVDGVLVVDYPPEESSELARALKARAIDSIYLLSPTTEDERMEAVGRAASGYVYYVSLKGVTGAGHLDLTEVSRKIAQIRTHTSLPIGVGFGIRDAQTARAVAGVADAVVVGSRLVQEIENSPRAQVAGNLRAILSDMRKALDEGRAAS